MKRITVKLINDFKEYLIYEEKSEANEYERKRLFKKRNLQSPRLRHSFLCLR